MTSRQNYRFGIVTGIIVTSVVIFYSSMHYLIQPNIYTIQVEHISVLLNKARVVGMKLEIFSLFCFCKQFWDPLYRGPILVSSTTKC